MAESQRVKGWRCGVQVFEDFTDHVAERSAVHLYPYYREEDPHIDILMKVEGISTPTTSSLETLGVEKKGAASSNRDVFISSYPSLRRIAQSLLWSTTPLRDQPDHVAEAVLASWEASEAWDGQAAFTTYAYKVIKNHLYHLNRRHSVGSRSYKELPLDESTKAITEF